MEVRTYNGEHFERSIARYIVFWGVLMAIIILSLRKMNIFWAIILFIIAGGYILFSLTKNKHISIIIRTSWVVIDTRLRTWSTLESFVVEVDKKSQERKNIVLIQKTGNPMIFSFDDTDENKKNFVEELQKYIPLVASSEESWIDKLARRLKL